MIHTGDFTHPSYAPAIGDRRYKITVIYTVEADGQEEARLALYANPEDWEFELVDIEEVDG